MVHALVLIVMTVSGSNYLPNGMGLVPEKEYKLDLLIADLQSDNPKERDRALTHLFDLASRRKCDQLGDRKKEVAGLLVNFLDDVEERRNVLMILGAIGPDAKVAVPRIIRFLPPNTGDDHLGLSALGALEKIGENATEALPAIIDSFTRPLPVEMTHYRRGIPNALFSIGPKDPLVKKTLLKGIEDEDVGVRVNSALALWRLGIHTAELKEIWAKAQKDKEIGIRFDVGWIAARLARESPELLPLALLALNDAESSVRYHTLSVLVEGNFKQPEVLEGFIKKLTDSDESIRIVACSGLGKMGPNAEKAIPQLRNCLQDKELAVRVYSGLALYKVDPTTVRTGVEVLKEGLGHESNFVRAYSAKGLREIGPKAASALPSLRRALLDDWPDVRKDAAAAISAIEFKGRRPTPRPRPVRSS